MAGTLRRTKLAGWYEYYREVCPVCGHRGMCMVNVEDCNKVVCCRVSSDIDWGKNSSMPGWLHLLDGKPQKIDVKHIDVMTQDKKEDWHLNRVYRAMLSELFLRAEHKAILQNADRDMTEEEIRIRQYRSFPEKPYETAKRVVERLGSHDDVIGVPGFYSKEGKYGRYFTLSGFSKSILIPFRNIKNEIVGFQWRVDEVKNQVVYIKKEKDFFATEENSIVTAKYKSNTIFKGKMPLKEEKSFFVNKKVVGTIKVEKGNRYMWLSSANKESGTGAGPLPIHVAVPTKKLEAWKTGETLEVDTVIITEGPIKADKSAELLADLLTEEEKKEYGEVVLSIPGINSWNILLPFLKEMKVKTINLGFDMDLHTNKDVKHHFKACFQALYKEGYDVNFLFWEESEGKGLDDLLIKTRLLPIKVNGKDLMK